MNPEIPHDEQGVTELFSYTAFDAEQSAAWREVVKWAISNFFYLLWAVYIIHRRVLGYKLREANRRRLEKMEETIQENIILRRLLLALRNITEPNNENHLLLAQIDEQLKMRVLPK